MNVCIKFEVHSFTHSWDNIGYLKTLGSPWICPRSLLSKILNGFFFVRIDPVNVLAKFEVRSFTHSWDNRGYLKTLGSPWICWRSLFSKMFNGLLFGWTLWIYRPNLKSVTLLVPEIIAIEVLGGEEAVRGRGWYHSKEHWWVPIGPL